MLLRYSLHRQEVRDVKWVNSVGLDRFLTDSLFRSLSSLLRVNSGGCGYVVHTLTCATTVNYLCFKIYAYPFKLVQVY